MNQSKHRGNPPISPSFWRHVRMFGYAAALLAGVAPALVAAAPPVENPREKTSELTAANPDGPSFQSAPPGGPSWEPGKPVVAPEAAFEESAGNKWFENLSLFGGLDGSKAPEDLGINANFGIRGAVNWGLPVWEEQGLGAQVGSAINYSQTAVRVLRGIDGVTDRTQSFSTVGVFQRTDFGLNWGVGYDFLFESYYKDLHFGQWRGQVGYGLNDRNELGVWGAVHDRGDHATVDGESFSLRSITQGNLYWRHIWSNETVTRIWAGVAESHGRFVIVSPGNTPVQHPFVFGADLYVPLTDRISLFGEANFITPNDTGTVTATLGFAFYPDASAKRAGRSRFAPLLPVANNPTFAVDLRQ
jgi:hypothetical protein